MSTTLAKYYSTNEIKNILSEFDRNKLNVQIVNQNRRNQLEDFDVLPLTVKTECFYTVVGGVSEFGEKLTLTIKHQGFPFVILINTLVKDQIRHIKQQLETKLQDLEKSLSMTFTSEPTDMFGKKYRFYYEFGKRPRGYTLQNELYTYMIIIPSNVALRNKIMKEMELRLPRECLMCNNDTIYHRILGRELGISFTDWIHINKCFESRDNNAQKLQTDSANNGYRWLTVTQENLSKSSKIHKVEPTVIMGWDIETTMINGVNCLPVGTDPNSRVYMISMVFCDFEDPNPFLRICLIDTQCYEAKIDDQYHTFVCKDELDMIMTFADIINIVKPDYITGFNDGEYDWPFLLAKMEKNKKIDEFNYRINRTRISQPLRNFIFRKEIKLVKGNNSNITTLQDPGFIAFDTRLILRKWHHQEKTSLNAYLTANNLDLKDDMPIPLTFKYYREHDPHGLQKVAHYCVIDATRCYELLFKLKIIQRIRDECSLAFVSFVDGIYYANAMKVKNLIAHYAYHHNPRIYFPMGNQHTSPTTSKYQGATVFSPDKGIEKTWPTIAFDFASLYPSLIQAYNLSPDTWIPLIEQSDSVAKTVKTNCNHILPLASLQNNNGVLILNNEDTGNENCNFIRHNNNLENFGIYPKIMYELMKERSRLKKIMFDYKMKLDSALKSGASPSEISDLSYFYEDANSKQNAVKVFMNSFYGEAGNAQSPLYLRQLAASITYLGRRNINFVVDFITKDMGCKMKYGDTDSMYIQLPISEYSDIVEKYNSNLELKNNKKDYAIELVNRMFERTDKYQKAVNNKLIEDNNTPYLKMAYEEVLFPSIFLGKKKYLGIQHVGIAGFTGNDKDIFKRGMDFLKEGNCQFVKKIGMEIVRRALDVNDTNTDIVKIVLDTISDFRHEVEDLAINDRQKLVNMFIQTGQYRPDKDNKRINMFIEYTTERYNKMSMETPVRTDIALYAPPEASSRFDYVVVKKQTGFDFTGKKITYKTGEIMELAEIVKINNLLEIDIDYYIEHYVASNCARFINFLDEFCVGGSNDIEIDKFEPDKKLYQKMDQEAIKKAKNFLIDKLIKVNYDKEAAKKQRKLYNETKKSLKNIITSNSLCEKMPEIEYNTSKIYSLMTKKLIKNCENLKNDEIAIRFKSYVDNSVIRTMLNKYRSELDTKLNELNGYKSNINLEKITKDKMTNVNYDEDEDIFNKIQMLENETQLLWKIIRSYELLIEYTNSQILKINN